MTINGNLPVRREYRMTVSALAEAAKRRDGELAGAELAYQDSVAAAAAALARAQGEAEAADRWAGSAAAAVLELDQEAARLWDRLRRGAGWRLRAWEDLPEPADVEAFGRTAAIAYGRHAPAQRGGPAREALDRAAERIDRATQRVSRRPLPRRVLPLLPVAGAVIAAATWLVGAGLLALGQVPSGAGAVLRALGWLVFLVAPSAGVPLVAYAAHRRFDGRLDLGGVALTLLGGMLTATTLSVTHLSR